MLKDICQEIKNNFSKIVNIELKIEEEVTYEKDRIFINLDSNNLKNNFGLSTLSFYPEINYTFLDDMLQENIFSYDPEITSQSHIFLFFHTSKVFDTIPLKNVSESLIRLDTFSLGDNFGLVSIRVNEELMKHKDDFTIVSFNRSTSQQILKSIAKIISSQFGIDKINNGNKGIFKLYKSRFISLSEKTYHYLNILPTFNANIQPIHNRTHISFRRKMQLEAGQQYNDAITMYKECHNNNNLNSSVENSLNGISESCYLSCIKKIQNACLIAYKLINDPQVHPFIAVPPDHYFAIYGPLILPILIITLLRFFRLIKMKNK